jgi:hypothetical protein
MVGLCLIMEAAVNLFIACTFAFQTAFLRIMLFRKVMLRFPCKADEIVDIMNLSKMYTSSYCILHKHKLLSKVANPIDVYFGQFNLKILKDGTSQS